MSHRARTRIALAITTLATGGAVLIPSAATAADESVGDLPELRNAISASCSPGDVVKLGTDVSASGQDLISSCPEVTLDLNGHDLTLRTMVLDAGTHLTVTDTAGGSGTLSVDAAAADRTPGIRTTGAELSLDGGTVTAVGGPRGAGIGGGQSGAGGQITINGGSISATGGDRSAGIGGGSDAAGGTIVVTDGTIVANGGSNAAGIGSGIFGDEGSDITITGGSITATGGSGGAGIGSGAGTANSGPVRISGGTVEATGGDAGAGIGGGFGSYSGNGGAGPITISGGAVTTVGSDSVTPGIGAAGLGGGGGAGAGGEVRIGAGAVVTASGAETAVGAGNYGTEFGTLDVAGTLRVPSGDLVIPDSVASGPEVRLAETGLITGKEADPTNGAQFRPGGAYLNETSGQVQNAGVITLATDLVTGRGSQIEVFDQHHILNLDAQTGTLPPGPDTVSVFASTLQAGLRTLPIPDLDGFVFAGWNTAADGTGVTVETSTILPDNDSDDPVETTLYAQWVQAPAFGDDGASVVEATVGREFSWTPEASGTPDPDVTLSGDLPQGLTFVAGTITGTPVAAAGDYPVTLTATNGVDPDAVLNLVITLTAGAVDELAIDPPTKSINEDTSVEFTVTGTDAGANQLGDLTGQTTFSADDDSVTFDGATATFPDPGTYDVTASIDDVSSTATITVNDLPSIEPDDQGVTPLATVGEAFTYRPILDGDPELILTDGELPEGVELVDGTLTGTPLDAAGDYPITLSAENQFGADALDLVITLNPGSPVDLTLDPSATTVEEGESITVGVTGTDAAGNNLGDLSDQTTLTSSVTSDQIDGNRVTFPTASVHTITATVVDTQRSVDITVVPTDADLDPPADEPETGADSTSVPPAVRPGDAAVLPDSGGGLSATFTVAALAAGLALVAAGVLLTRRRS